VAATETTPIAPEQVPLEEVRLGDWDFWTKPHDWREGAFATLRREAPVTFFPEIALPTFPPGPGYWSLTRHDDVWHASRNPRLFSSVPSIVIQDAPPEIAEYFGSMIVLDDPRHNRLRGIVEKAFRPRVVAQVEESVRARARRLVEQMVAAHPDGQAEFVSELAGPLPLQVICDMMGIPEEDEARVFYWTNIILGEVQPDPEVGLRVAQDIGTYALELAEARRAKPGEDLTTALVEADVDGDRLSSQEIASFFILLATAGNETTRNAISHGLYELTRRPDQKALWWSDFDGVAKTAVEEIVRWASPVIYMRRRATEDTEIRGQRIAAGDKVVLWYNSANRDETVFENPYVFDVRRSPNDHVGFGGGGPHFCLGANLARREITVMLREVFRRLPNLEITGEPDYLQSGFINGIKRMPCAF
jgi:methyl-branched lipid omega-hydroxylase